MFNGQNASGKEFDVINEDQEIIGSFSEHRDAVSCLRTAHWTNGDCNIRRDLAVMAANHAAVMAVKKSAMANFYLAYA